MGNDKATAWLTLADADAVDKRVLDIIARALHGYNVDNMDNQKQLGMALLMNFAVNQHLRGLMLDTLMQEITTNLRMDTYLDPHHQNLHIRLTYKGNGVTQQTVNLRRY